MKKSAFIITGLLIATQSFATDLTGSSASCDSGVLGTEEGGVALRATFEPESIELRWYDNDKNLISVSNEQSSCTYGAGINVPTAPQRTGYKFNGWKVINIFSTLDTSINTTWDATHTRWKPINGSDGYTMTNYFGTENSSDLSNGKWSDTFSYGTVIGNAMCSTTSGTWATAGTPANDGGQYCWCMATGYQPADSDVVYSPNSPLSWVFDSGYGSASDCAVDCANYCADGVRGYSAFRQAVFGAVQ